MGDDASVGAAPEKRGFSWVVLPAVLFAGLALLFFVALQSGNPSRLPSALVGKPVPTMSFAPLEGLNASGKPVPGVTPELLSDGNVTLVNFWASWCAPCVEEHPVLVAIGQRTGVRIVGINYKDPPPGGRRFLGRYGNPYAAVGVDASGRGAIEWGVAGMPETFVIDGKGRVRYKHIGPIFPKDVETKILPALAAAQAAN